MYVLNVDTQKTLGERLMQARDHLMQILENAEEIQKTEEVFHPTISYQSIANLKRIGQGGFSIVLKGVVLGTSVAIKSIKSLSKRNSQG